eukprot:432189-Pelagomonas_calceolata.AAC.1
MQIVGSSVPPDAPLMSGKGKRVAGMNFSLLSKWSNPEPTITLHSKPVVCSQMFAVEGLAFLHAAKHAWQREGSIKEEVNEAAVNMPFIQIIDSLSIQHG